MYWINFFHIYQPFYQNKETLEKVSKESYQTITRVLLSHPRIKFTANISGVLIDLLSSHHQNILADFKKLVARGQLELTGSAKHHPLLPLLPKEEILRQIKLNENTLRKFFGSLYNPQGFYIPEMAYHREVAKIAKKLGFKWLILDEIALGKLNLADANFLYTIKNIGLKAVFRNRKISKTYIPTTIAAILERKELPPYLITANDGELYAYHLQDPTKSLTKILKNKKIKTLTISQYLKRLTVKQDVHLVPSNWETTPSELKRKIPYALWDDPQNPIHKYLWRLAYLAIEFVKKKPRDANFSWSRLHLDQGLASCTWWWASGRDIRYPHPPAWYPEFVEKGALELMRSIRSFHQLPFQQRMKAEKLYVKIIEKIWQKHWKIFQRQK